MEGITVDDSVINRSRIEHNIYNTHNTFNTTINNFGSERVAKKNINLFSMSGDIRCNVDGPGRIKTMSGDIDLFLSAPLEVIATTMAGDISIDGLVFDGHAYAPPGERPIGVLFLETMSGDIFVKYSH